MVKTIVDCCVLSQSWFKKILPELVSNSNVLFVFTSHEKMMNEVNENREHYLKLYKEAGLNKRRVDVDKEVISDAIAHLNANPDWNSNIRDCDDPHIFALVSATRTNYVFSTDIRMVNCRDCIRPSIKAKFCRFKVISSLALFVVHKSAIISKYARR